MYIFYDDQYDNIVCNSICIILTTYVDLAKKNLEIILQAFIIKILKLCVREVSIGQPKILISSSKSFSS